MAPLFLDPGLFAQRVALQIADETPNASGGAAVTWRTLAEMSVAIEPVAVALTERFDQREANVTHRVICRARDELDRGMAFLLKGRRLTIRSVHDPDESGRYLVCRCEEQR